MLIGLEKSKSCELSDLCSLFTCDNSSALVPNSEVIYQLKADNWEGELQFTHPSKFALAYCIPMATPKIQGIKLHILLKEMIHFVIFK